MTRVKCPRCGNNKSWSIRRNKRKCAACKYEWPPQKLPLQISRKQWRQLIRHFLASETIDFTVKKVNLGRGQVLRAFGIIRTALRLDIPAELTAISPDSQPPESVYIVHLEHYHQLEKKKKLTGRNPIASLNGVYALVSRNEKAWGQLISGQTGRDLEKILKDSAEKTIPWSPILDRYTGVITKTRLYFLNFDKKSGGRNFEWVCYSIWVHLKEFIAEKHGIRREQLPLYMAEIIWRYNYDELDIISQGKRILSLLQDRRYQTKRKPSTLDNRTSANDVQNNNLLM